MTSPHPFHSPRHRHRSAFLLLLTVTWAVLRLHASDPTAPRTPVSLTLDQAFERAERSHPALAEARARVDAAAGLARHSGAFPNPELIVGAQQIPVQRETIPDRQYIAGFSQRIPLGNRLAKAREAEWLQREVQVRGLESAQRTLHRRVHAAFATALHHESALQTHARILSSLTLDQQATRARLLAGDAIPADLARAELELARAGIESRRIASLREQGLVALAGAIGEPGLSIGSVEGRLDDAFEVPTLESLAASLSTQPAARIAEADVRASVARIDLAKAERIPDIQVEALYRRLEVTGQNTFDIGLNIPLPLFNRNQGRIQAARSDALAAEARSRMTTQELALHLQQSHAALVSALDRARSFREEILPHADAVLQSAELRLAAGDTSLTEILPLRREWARLHLDYLETLREVMSAWVEVSAYLGPRSKS